MASSNPPCAACKFLRRKCIPECVFAPYFPPEDPYKFANAHKIFGASNISKILNDLPHHQRADAVCSLAYEAEARIKDPVHGCVKAITYLSQCIAVLNYQLNVAQSELYRLTGIVDITRGSCIYPQAGHLGNVVENHVDPQFCSDLSVSPKQQMFSSDQLWNSGREQRQHNFEPNNQLLREHILDHRPHGNFYDA